MSGDQVPWLSVITVVKDDEPGLAATAASLETQDLTDVEWIVIDSSDTQSDIRDLLNASLISSIQYLWEEPQGIYSAMNAGIAAANGEYVYFANAGDVLTNPEVIASVRRLAFRNAPDWIVGRIEIMEASQQLLVSPLWDFDDEQRNFFARGFFAPHQGTFVRRNLIDSLGGFNTDYAISADYALFLQLSCLSRPLMTDLVIARFFEGGASSREWRKSFWEFHVARRRQLEITGLDSVREYLATVLHFSKVASVKALRKIGAHT